MPQTALREFEPQFASALIEFANHLQEVEADAFVFLARKSMCLYDLLLDLKTPPLQSIVLSDRILDMRLDTLKGKRVALVDDSLIVGSSLAHAKERFEREAGAQVSTHVLCADSDWWIPELITPDSTILVADDLKVMSYCSAAVRALSLIPRPYIVDFPMTEHFCVPVARLNGLLSDGKWRSYRLTTDDQARRNIEVYTHIPSHSLMDRIAALLGESAVNLVEVMKVRSYCSVSRTRADVRLVPIMTLGPTPATTIGELFEHLLSAIENQTGRTLSGLRFHAVTASSQQRTVQYILSCVLGQLLIETLQPSEGVRYDLEEAARHYGPWLAGEMGIVHSVADAALEGRPFTAAAGQASVPESVAREADEILEASIRCDTGKPTQVGAADFFYDFCSPFTHLFDEREIPFRRALKTAAAAGDSTAIEAVIKGNGGNRLQSGIPIRLLVDRITGLYGLNGPTWDSSDDRRGLLSAQMDGFSVLLDTCNDLGIAVPITCEKDGLVFRAYRHGEDVRFSRSEMALIQRAMRGALDAAPTRTGLSKLFTEKLVVALLRIGVAQGFLQAIYGLDGPAEQVARIGFGLMGARPKLRTKDRNDMVNEVFLVKHMVRERALAKGNDGLYKLGRPIEGNHLHSKSPGQAYEIGYILGELGLATGPESGPLDDKKLTLLVTCPDPRSAAAALAVELRLFGNWLREHVEADGLLAEHLDWQDSAELAKRIKSISRSAGPTALNSAVLKGRGYFSGQVPEIVKECSAHLRTALKDPLSANRWEEYWQDVVETDRLEERRRFDDQTRLLLSACWSCLASLHLAIAALDVARWKCTTRRRTNWRPSILGSFIDTEARLSNLGVVTPAVVEAVRDRLLTREGWDDFDAIRVYEYAKSRMRQVIDSNSYLASSVEAAATSFGMFEHASEFSLVLYFDVIDSRCRRDGFAVSRELRCSERIPALRRRISDAMTDLIRQAANDKTEVHCWNGRVIDSNNDGSHVFFRGPRDMWYAAALLERLFVTSASLGVPMRAFLAPCAFVPGCSAFKRRRDPEVRGDRFWGHFTGLREWMDVRTAEATASTFAVVGSELIGKFRLPNVLQWKGLPPEDVDTEMTNDKRITPASLGEIHVGYSEEDFDEGLI